MRSTKRLAAVMTFVLGFGSVTFAQEAKTPAQAAAIIKAMDNAMDPGEGQKKLEFLVGTFDVKILVWLAPSAAPIESRGVAVHTWVLGHRYVQTMMSAYIMGEPFSAIGYAGYDNLAQKYVATYIDSGSTGMEWYTGGLSPDGKLASMSGTIIDDMTLKPTRIEMRLSITPDGNHVTSMWKADPSGKMFKIIEVEYKRKNS
jgi:hypothetical protein